MAEIKDKLVTAESLKNVYDTLNNNINQVSDKMDNLPQADWNQNDTTAADYVKNRPFYEESKTLFEWDGNTEGLDAVDFDGANVYRVPNIEYVSSDNFIGALAVVSEGSETVITDEDINLGSNGCFFVGGIIYIPYDNFNYEGIITFPKAGAYHTDTEVSGGTYFKSIKNTVIKKIDEKFLPDKPTVFTVTETSYGVVDKTDDEIATAILHGDIVKLHSKNRNDKILSLNSYQKFANGTIMSPFLFSLTNLGSDIKISHTIQASVSNQTVKYTYDETLININSKVFELTNNMMTKPSTASVGQILTIAGIDESGSPTKLVAENKSSELKKSYINIYSDGSYDINSTNPSEVLRNLYTYPKEYMIALSNHYNSNNNAECISIHLYYIYSYFKEMDITDYVAYVGQSEKKRYIVKIYFDRGTREYSYTVDITDLATEEYVDGEVATLKGDLSQLSEEMLTDAELSNAVDNALAQAKESGEFDGAKGDAGVGIQSVVQTTTSTVDGGTNVVTVTKTDGTSSTFQVRNGGKGKSAYQYAQEGGYTGTEEEFKEKLSKEYAEPIYKVAMTADDIAPALDPGKKYDFPDMTSLAYTLAPPSDSAEVAMYWFVFGSPADTATTVTHPEGVTVDGSTIAAGKRYEVQIADGLAIIKEWEAAS